MTDDLDIGLYVVGEKPAPVEYQFMTSAGVSIDLTGYTGKFSWAPEQGTGTTVDATLTDPAAGKVTHTWTGAEFLQSGNYHGEFWVGNTVSRFASQRLVWKVRMPINGTPEI